MEDRVYKCDGEGCLSEVRIKVKVDNFMAHGWEVRIDDGGGILVFCPLCREKGR